MPTWGWFVIAAVAVEAIAIALVFPRMKAKFSVVIAKAGELAAFSSDLDRAVTDYMTANFGGHAGQLPSVLAGLLDHVRPLATARGMSLEEDLLRMLVARSVASRGFAGRAEVRRAMDSIPRPDVVNAA
jgi:hypothetical protein